MKQFSSNSLDIGHCLKEGWLQKKSRHINQWRRRWIVLDKKSSTISTFKHKEEYKDPTEHISMYALSFVMPLARVDSVQEESKEKLYASFCVHCTYGHTFEFRPVKGSRNRAKSRNESRHKENSDIEKYERQESTEMEESGEDLALPHEVHNEVIEWVESIQSFILSMYLNSSDFSIFVSPKCTTISEVDLSTQSKTPHPIKCLALEESLNRHEKPKKKKKIVKAIAVIIITAMIIIT
ncbi:hypothetical protein RFI_13540, partial [Reticulomyxa filosa]